MTDPARIRRHLQDELDGAALYSALAESEGHPTLKQVYERMAAVERRHAKAWAERLRLAGEPEPALAPSWRARLLAGLARRFGAGLVLPTLAAGERAASRRYRRLGEAETAGMAADESHHARLLALLTGTGPGGIEGGTLARVEGRHRTGGNALRAAVLGASDGLLSNLSLVMGVAGAALDSHAILLTGLAGLLAGAGSMALGEWLSVQSARELAESQIQTERDEIEAAPAEEAEELALIYQAKGLPPDQARHLAGEIMSDRSGALDTLVREELGIDPESLGGSAWEAALTSFVLFAVGAIVPVAPFFLWSGRVAVLGGLAAGAVGLFVLGAGTSLFTGRGALYSGSRQLGFGMAAAALTYAVGRVLGAALAG